MLAVLFITVLQNERPFVATEFNIIPGQDSEH